VAGHVVDVGVQSFLATGPGAKVVWEIHLGDGVGRLGDMARFMTRPTTDNLHVKQHNCSHEKLAEIITVR